MREFTATDGPLLEWLLEALKPMSRTGVKQLLKHGQIHVNGQPTKKFDYPLKAGDRVAIAKRERPDPLAEMLGKAGMPLVHFDDHLLLIDKPGGLLSVETDSEKADTAFAVLCECLTANRRGKAFVVHRLDRGTSGLIMFARSEIVRDQLQGKWEGVQKTYLAVVEGTPRQPHGEIRNYLTEGKDLHVRATSVEKPDAKLAVTRYRVRQSGPRYCLVEVDLETGRKHQIRVHLAGLGCPVIGDSIYGQKAGPAGRLGLHAWKLSFDHPATGERVEFESPLPKELRQAITDEGPRGRRSGPRRR